MSESASPEPVLAPAMSAGTRGTLPLVAAIGIALAIGGFWKSAPSVDDNSEHAASLPYSRSDLGFGLVTPIKTADPAALARALPQIDIPPVERERLKEQIAGGELSLGLIAFWDDVVADGDAVTVASAGVRQVVALGKALTPVVTPYQPGGTVLITAVRDGGGSVTVAVMTRNGPVHLRRLLVGETIEVPAP